MLIMECRYIILQKLLAAFGRTQVPLVGFDGSKLIPFLTFDDVGLYLFVPKIVQFFNVSLQHAIDTFFYAQIACASVLGIVGLLLLFRSNIARFVSLLSFCLFLGFIFYQLRDVYIAYFASFFAIIPLFLYFILNNNDSKLFNYFLVIAGIVIGASHYVRSYSSLPVLGFIVCMVLLNRRFVLMKKITLLWCVFLGIFIAGCYFENVIGKYKNFAQTHFKEFDSLQTKHVFWHQVYIGFGFLKFNNKDNIMYDDSCGDHKVRQIDPEISMSQTSSYEAVLKNEVFKLIRTQFSFVVWTIFAKLGVLLFYLIFFANVGLLAFFYTAFRYDLVLSFLCTFGLSSITPLLTVPIPQYALSFICCAFVFGLFYTQQFLEQLNIKGYISKIISKKLFDYQFTFKGILK